MRSCFECLLYFLCVCQWKDVSDELGVTQTRTSALQQRLTGVEQERVAWLAKNDECKIEIQYVQPFPNSNIPNSNI